MILLKRGARYALRVKDNQSASRTRFTDLRWYPIDEDWKITARFVPALRTRPRFRRRAWVCHRGPFPVQAPDKAPETCTWSTRSADRGSQVSALGVGLPSGTPFRCRHRIKHRKRAPGQRGLRVGANLLSRNLDGNQIAWKYRRCAGHANLLFRDGVKRQVGKCDCLLEFTTRPELSKSLFQKPYAVVRLRGRLYRNRSRYFAPVSRRSIN